MTAEEKFLIIGKESGVISFEPLKPVAQYLPYRITGNLVFISGQGCKVNGAIKNPGKVGKDLTIQEGCEAAKIAAFNCLMVLKSAISSLDKVNQIVNVRGYVNSASGFTDQPLVINGASELLIEVFGEKGKHSRCALSANELPNNNPVELEMVVEVDF